MEIDPLPLVLFFFLGALMQGFLGFGFGLIAMGGLSLGHDLQHAAAVVNVAGLVQMTWMVISLRRHVRWSIVLPLVPPVVVGIAAGLLALESGEAELLKRALGVVIASIAAWNLWGRSPAGAPPRWQDVPVGLISGIFTGLFNTGGPPLVAHIYRRPDPPPTLKGTLQALFLIGGSIRLLAALSRGMIGPSVWIDASVGAVAGVSGVACGLILSRYSGPERFRRLSWIGLAILGLALVAGT